MRGDEEVEDLDSVGVFGCGEVDGAAGGGVPGESLRNEKMSGNGASAGAAAMETRD